MEKGVILAHDRIGHLPIVDLFKLADNGRLPKKYLQLKGKTTVCSSCVFVKAKRRNWCTVGHLVHFGLLLK